MRQHQDRTAVDAVQHFLGLRALVVGDAILDTFLDGTATRICREAPVPVVTRQAEQTAPGGAANMAANIAALGAESTFVCLVGCDEPADRLRSALRAAGVDDRWLVDDTAVTTVHKHRVIADDQYIARIDDGDLTACTPESRAALVDHIERLLPYSDLIVLSDYGYGTTNDELLARLRSYRDRFPSVLAVDAKDMRRYARMAATVITPNKDEALLATHLDALSAEWTMNRVAQALREKVDAELIAITLASGSALLVDADGTISHLPANSAKPASDVGSGDSFAGAMALALASGASGAVAAQIGIDAASIACTKRGTAVVTHRELIRRTSLSVQTGSYGSLSPKEVVASVDTERHAGRRIVFTNGVFDILHAGHVELLRPAKEFGDILVVGVNSDASVRRLKGEHRPVNREQNRLAVVAALHVVDYALIFSEDTPAETIRLLQPHVHVKGGDYSVESLPEIGAVREVGARVEILPLVEGLSTTGIIRGIRSQSHSAVVKQGS